MSARQRMTMRAYQERNKETGTDVLNQPLPANFKRFVILPCYAWIRAKRHVQDSAGAIKSALIEDFRAIVPRGTDITEADQLESIRDRKETIIFSGPIRIEGILKRTDHLELLLKGVHGAGC